MAALGMIGGIGFLVLTALYVGTFVMLCVILNHRLNKAEHRGNKT